MSDAIQTLDESAAHDRWPEEDEDGCTCPRELGAGGARKTDEWCPLHGRDPDEAYERMKDDR